MSVALSTLYPELRTELPGIPEPLLVAATKRITRQFFRKSEAWRYDLDSVVDYTIALTFPVITAGTHIPTDTHVVRIDKVRYGVTNASRTLLFVPRDQLDRENPDWSTETGTSPKYWTNIAAGAARIIPIASATVASSLHIRAVIAPNPDLTSIPDFLFYEFEETIKFGVLAQLMKIPGKDWSAANLATLYEKKFQNGINQAKSKAQAEYGQPNREMVYGGIPFSSASARRVDDYGK